MASMYYTFIPNMSAARHHSLKLDQATTALAGNVLPLASGESGALQPNRVQLAK